MLIQVIKLVYAASDLHKDMFSVNCPMTAPHRTEHKNLTGQSLKSKKLVTDTYWIVPLCPRLPSDLCMKAIP